MTLSDKAAGGSWAPTPVSSLSSLRIAPEMAGGPLLQGPLIFFGYSRIGTCQALSRHILRGEFLGSQLMRSSLRKYVHLTWLGSVKIRTGKLWLHPHLFWTGPWSFSVAFWNSTWLFTSCFVLERILQPDVETALFFCIPEALPEPHWPVVQQHASI